MRVDKSGALEKSTDVTDLPVYEFNIALETTGGDVSFLNRKDGIHNRIIHNIVRASLIYSNQYAKKWRCAAETSAEVYRFKIHNALDNTSPRFSWYVKRPNINELSSCGWDIYPITSKHNKLEYRTQEVTLMGNTNSRATIKWWDPHTKQLRF